MKRILATLLGALLIVPGVSASHDAVSGPVAIYSADIPIRALRRLGPMRVEVSETSVRAQNRFARGWVTPELDRLVVRWQRPPLRASLPASEISGTLASLLDEDERAAGVAPRLRRLSDPEDSIRGYPVELYRIEFSPTSSVDVWVTDELPRSEPFAELLPLAVASFSPEAAKLVRGIPGAPVQVELRSRRLGRVDLLKLEEIRERHTIEAHSRFAVPVPFARILVRLVMHA